MPNIEPHAPLHECLAAEARLMSSAIDRHQHSIPADVREFFQARFARLADLAQVAAELADENKRMEEQLNEQVSNYYAALGQGRVVVSSRLDRGLIAINGGKAIAEVGP